MVPQAPEPAAVQAGLPAQKQQGLTIVEQELAVGTAAVAVPEHIHSVYAVMGRYIIEVVKGHRAQCVSSGLEQPVNSHQLRWDHHNK
jgi:hypothetical protein